MNSDKWSVILSVSIAAFLAGPMPAKAWNLPFLSNSPGNGIVGGQLVESDDPISRHTVRLIIDNKNGTRSSCTGTVVSETLVLTAAHCLENQPRAVLLEFRGIDSENPETRDVDRTWSHPRYKDSTQTKTKNDIALVHFTGGLPPFAEPVDLYPADLAPQIELSAEPIPVEIAGYGRTSPNGNVSAVLNKTHQQAVAPVGDMILLKPLEGEVQSSACSGDSGGPAFIEHNGRMKQWGVSKAVTKPFCLSNSLYTNIFPHLNALAAAAQALNRAR